jgi:hypothetical protein
MEILDAPCAGVEDRSCRGVIPDPGCLLTDSASSARAAPGGIPGLLERPAEVSGPRHPRGVRRALAAVLELSACAVLARTTPAPTPGELDDKSPRSAAS